MPTILREAGFSVMIYTADHMPMHVHVWKAGCEAVINLSDISVRGIDGMSAGDVRRAQAIVAAHRKQLISKWKRIKPIP